MVHIQSVCLGWQSVLPVYLSGCEALEADFVTWLAACLPACACLPVCNMPAGQQAMSRQLGGGTGPATHHLLLFVDRLVGRHGLVWRRGLPGVQARTY